MAAAQLAIREVLKLHRSGVLGITSDRSGMFFLIGINRGL
jgi:hypothetical protein